MKEAAKAHAGSKKSQATVAGVVLVVGTQYLGLDPYVAEQVAQLVAAVVSAYLLGQGVADVGKERAKVEAANGNGGAA